MLKLFDEVEVISEKKKKKLPALAGERPRRGRDTLLEHVKCRIITNVYVLKVSYFKK